MKKPAVLLFCLISIMTFSSSCGNAREANVSEVVMRTIEAKDFPEAKRIESVDGKGLEEFETVEKTAEVFFSSGAKIRSAVLANEGKLYFGNEDCDFFAVDSKTGEQIWLYKTDFPVQTLPVFSDGKIIFNAANDLYILDAESGAETAKISHTPDEQVKTRRLSNEPYSYNDTRVAVWDGAAYYIALNGDLVAVDINSGEKVSEFKSSVSGAAGSGVNIYEGKAYWVDYAGALCCVSLAENSMVFRILLGDRVYAPMLIDDGKIYAAGRICMVYCVDAQSGDVIWRSYSNDPTSWFSGGSVCVGDIVYCGVSDEHTLVSFNKNTGEFNRLYPTGANVYTAPALNAGNIVVAATNVYTFNKSFIMEFDVENNVKLWEAALDECVLSSPAVYDGAVYFGADSGDVYRVGL